MKKIRAAILKINSAINEFKLKLQLFSLKFQNFSAHPFCGNCATEELAQINSFSIPIDIVALEASGLGRKNSYAEFKEDRCAWAFCNIHGCLNGQ